MNVQIHEMDPRIARIHYHDYLKRVRTSRERRREQIDQLAKEAGQAMRRTQIQKTRLEREDEELKIAYRELSREKRIVILPEALRKAGIDVLSGLPNLAIVKADAEWCYFHGNKYCSGRRSGFHSGFDSCKYFDGTPLWFTELFPPETTNLAWRNQQRREGRTALKEYPVRAMVPKVPPRLAPDRLGGYWILFEPKWEDILPDPDPILLSRASETIFVVVAVWDMTPIESAALGLR
jgi:hypothetical protein